MAYFNIPDALEMIEKEDDYQVHFEMDLDGTFFNLMLVGMILIGTILTKIKDNELQPT